MNKFMHVYVQCYHFFVKFIQILLSYIFVRYNFFYSNYFVHVYT